MWSIVCPFQHILLTLLLSLYTVYFKVYPKDQLHKNQSGCLLNADSWTLPQTYWIWVSACENENFNKGLSGFLCRKNFENLCSQSLMISPHTVTCFHSFSLRTFLGVFLFLSSGYYHISCSRNWDFSFKVTIAQSWSFTYTPKAPVATSSSLYSVFSSLVHFFLTVISEVWNHSDFRIPQKFFICLWFSPELLPISCLA